MKKRCTGCEACRSGVLPTFATDEDLEVFWERHEPEQFPAYLRARKSGRPRKAEKRVTIHMAILPSLKETLQKLAAEKGIGYQTLMQMWLQERVDAELAQRR